MIKRKVTIITSIIVIMYTVIGYMSMNASAVNKIDYTLVFDAKYYSSRYPDLAAAGLKTDEELFAHFITCGMKEGRQGNEEFNVHAYKAKYPDLRKAFGDNLENYYYHYILFGKAEGRTGKSEQKTVTPTTKKTSVSPQATINKQNNNNSNNNNSNNNSYPKKKKAVKDMEVEYTEDGFEMINGYSATCSDGGQHNFEFDFVGCHLQLKKFHEYYKCTKCNAVGRKEIIPPERTEEEAYELIMAMQAEYPTGTTWNYRNSYCWDEPHGYCRGWACGGFAAMLSDAAFRYRSYTKHNDIYSVKVGDIVTDLTPNKNHQFVVLNHDGDYITIAEGNYSGKVNWGRQILKSDLEGNCEVLTRY